MVSIRFFRNFIHSLIIFATIFMSSPAVKAEDTMDTIITTLSSLTCETQGVGNLLRSEFSHTCIPAPMFTFFVANLISPGVYANTFLRVKINDDELFPNACKRANRIDPDNPRLSFAMCNNIDLAIQRTVAVINSAIVIAKSLFTGSVGDVWKDILNAWNIPKIKFHKMFIDQKEGDSGVMVDIGIIPVFPWKVIKDHDKLCVATISFAGWIPIGCKYIKEPFPKSIYADFIDLSPDESKSAVYDPNKLTSCSGAGGCYQRAYSNSKTSIVMSGPLVECVKTMIARLMISPQVCSLDDAQSVLGSSSRTSSSLFQFQVNMHKTVAALLTIYVILFGMKVILSGDMPEKAELVNFVLKFLFVIYFSIGINIHPGSGNDLYRMDGLIEWVFPFLLNGMTQLAGWVISASPSELCRFDASEYPIGMQHIALWDSLDCRVSHYIGLDILQTVAVNNAMMNHDFASMDILSFPIPPYLYLLIPAVISGNMTLVMLALMYPLMVISVAAFVVNATIVCMICIVILGILAPLFVPMLLFEYTKGYFDSYVKLMISFMLQPMVVVTFMTTMLSVYDFGFYGTCKYKSGSFPDGTRTSKVFFVDNDWSLYTQDDAKGCVNSLGYILNNPLAFLFGTAVDISKATFPGQDDPTRTVEEEKFPFLESIQPTPGLIFSTIEILYEKIRTLIISFLTAIFTLYLLYQFSEQLAEFAADMTEGVSVGNMSIKPQTLFKAGMAAMSGGKGLGKGGVGGAGGGATDKAATGGGTARDKVGTGGDSATDKAGSGAAKDTASTSGGKSEPKAEGKQHQWKSARPTALQGDNDSGNKPGGAAGKVASVTPTGRAATIVAGAKDTASTSGGKSEPKAEGKQHQWKSARPTALQGGNDSRNKPGSEARGASTTRPNSPQGADSANKQGGSGSEAKGASTARSNSPQGTDSTNKPGGSEAKGASTARSNSPQGTDSTNKPGGSEAKGASTARSNSPQGTDSTNKQGGSGSEAKGESARSNSPQGTDSTNKPGGSEGGTKDRGSPIKQQVVDGVKKVGGDLGE